MVTVHIPAPFQHYSGGRESVSVEGASVRHLVSALEESCPGIGEALMEDGKLRPGIAVAIDGAVQHLGALASTVNARDVVFIPAFSGG